MCWKVLYLDDSTSSRRSEVSRCVCVLQMDVTQCICKIRFALCQIQQWLLVVMGLGVTYTLHQTSLYYLEFSHTQLL